MTIETKTEHKHRILNLMELVRKFPKDKQLKNNLWKELKLYKETYKEKFPVKYRG